MPGRSGPVSGLRARFVCWAVSRGDPGCGVGSVDLKEDL
jgi:hypothetical protein